MKSFFVHHEKRGFTFCVTGIFRVEESSQMDASYPCFGNCGTCSFSSMVHRCQKQQKCNLKNTLDLKFAFILRNSSKIKFKPRLFECSDESGKLVVREICKYVQEVWYVLRLKKLTILFNCNWWLGTGRGWCNDFGRWSNDLCMGRCAC